MANRKTALTVGLAVLALLAANGSWAAGKFPALAQKNCLNCHSALKKMSNVVAGNLSGKSLTASTLQIKVNNKQEALKFSADTELRNAPEMDALKNGVALRVHYKMDGATRGGHQGCGQAQI